MDIKFNIKSMIYGILLILFILAGFIVLPKMFGQKIEPVDYVMVQRDAIPDKILNMMDDYVHKERAIALIIDEKVYVIVTRGENTDYGIEVNKINLQNKEDEKVMQVEILYKEKEKSYPFVVVETNMKSLPDKIELNKKFATKSKVN